MIDNYIIDTLDSYKKNIKRTKKSVFWNKMYILLCTFNLISHTYSIIYTAKGWWVLLYATLIIIWILAIYLTIQNIKSKNVEKSNNIQRYYDYFKLVDYPGYIKEMRIKN